MKSCITVNVDGYKPRRGGERGREGEGVAQGGRRYTASYNTFLNKLPKFDKRVTY